MIFYFFLFSLILFSSSISCDELVSLYIYTSTADITVYNRYFYIYSRYLFIIPLHSLQKLPSKYFFFFFTIPTFLLTQLQQISKCLHFATDMFIFTIDTLLFMIYDTYLYIYTAYSPAGSPRIRGHTSFCRRTADTCCSYTSGSHCETL